MASSAITRVSGTGQRHWLARFRRRSIVVSKTKRMVDVSLALFACFAGNSRISDLLSMLT
jgi:insertion element IS1 protein InsB